MNLKNLVFVANALSTDSNRFVKTYQQFLRFRLLPYSVTCALSTRRVKEIFRNNHDENALLSEAQFLAVMKEAQTQGANSFSGTLERARYPRSPLAARDRRFGSSIAALRPRSARFSAAHLPSQSAE